MAGRKGFSKFNDKRVPATFKIQVTSMVDMFVILLVFLLKSYSTSPVNITPNDSLTLPASSSTKDPSESLKLEVSKIGVFVEGKKVVDFVDGKLVDKDVDQSDIQFIRPLYNELDQQAQKSKNIASVNDTLEFDGKIIVQADRSLPYDVLRKIMYTSMMAGYADTKIAVISKD